MGFLRGDREGYSRYLPPKIFSSPLKNDWLEDVTLSKLCVFWWVGLVGEGMVSDPCPIKRLKYGTFNLNIAEVMQLET